jgi:hypothetical protein
MPKIVCKHCERELEPCENGPTLCCSGWRHTEPYAFTGPLILHYCDSRYLTKGEPDYEQWLDKT